MTLILTDDLKISSPVNQTCTLIPRKGNPEESAGKDESGAEAIWIF
jgi:hypothetical protein